jgi:hypothetical protein
VKLLSVLPGYTCRRSRVAAATPASSTISADAERCPLLAVLPLLQQRVGLPPESNTQLRRAQFVPNTPRTAGHQGFVGAIPSLAREQDPLVGLAFQAGHASSILVTHSSASALVKALSLRPSYSNKEMTRITRLVICFHDHRGATYLRALSGGFHELRIGWSQS